MKKATKGTGRARRRMTEDGTGIIRPTRGDRHINRTHATEAVRQRALQDEALSIDAAMQEALQNINWDRREKAERSLADWAETYCVPALLYAPIEDSMRDIMTEMERATSDSRPYQILVRRGGCKTTMAECAVAYYLATGKRKFAVVSSINLGQAKQILRDITRVFETEAFIQDYPAIGKPIELLDGHVRREQRQEGHAVDYRVTADEVILPTITMNGVPVPSSGSCIKARALSSVRGCKNGTLRPDIVLLDDVQTTEIAQSPEQCAKVLSLIRGDVMGLAGLNKAAIINLATTIAQDDVTEQLKRDKAWKTSFFPAILAWPKEWYKPEHGLWGQYLRMLDSEDNADKPHTDSLEFYRANRSKMDAGAKVLYANRYTEKDGHISALQRLIHDWREMGARAFASEMQMEPVREQYAFEITPKLILSRVRKGVPHLTVPEGCVYVAAATDINPSYALTTTIVCYDRDRTALVTEHVISRIHIDSRVNDTEYARKVYSALAEHGRAIKALGVKIDGWGIDAGGKQFDAVCSFAAMSMQLCGLPACAMVGRSQMTWTPSPKSRLRDAINRTVLCGERGRKWLLWDADHYKETAQRSWATETGAPGGLSLYEGAGHDEFAIQVSNERLISKRDRADGRAEYRWKTREPHDYGDCIAMCYAIAASQGLSANTGMAVATRKGAIVRRRPRIV